jgi:hypothetical protein
LALVLFWIELQDSELAQLLFVSGYDRASGAPAAGFSSVYFVASVAEKGKRRQTIYLVDSLVRCQRFFSIH